MSYGIICRQKIGDEHCKRYANHRFTWPGKNESYICDICIVKLRAIAVAFGLQLQTIPLTKEDHNGHLGMAAEPTPTTEAKS